MDDDGRLDGGPVVVGLVDGGGPLDAGAVDTATDGVVVTAGGVVVVAGVGVADPFT